MDARLDRRARTRRLRLQRFVVLASFLLAAESPPRRSSRAARRLEELRLCVLERRLDARLELGEYAALVPELESLVEQEPLREGLRRRLMVALYRSGRQAEALERYREGRSFSL